MSTLQLALQLPQDIDLRGFSLLLHTQNIAHRITLEGIYQVVWIASDEDPEMVIGLYQTWQAQRPAQGPVAPNLIRRLIQNALEFPVTVLMIVLNCCLAWVGLQASEGDFSGLIQQLTMTPMSMTGGYLFFEPLAATFAQQSYWRLLTPMLLHFSWLHLAFNLLWVWELGRRIEKLHGANLFLGVTLVGSLGANLMQFSLSGPGLFGGMSGVVFAYLGYCMVWDRLRPKEKIGLAPAAYWVMLGFLALGFTGLLDLLGLGALANGAHLGGLLAGAVIALLAPFLLRKRVL